MRCMASREHRWLFCSYRPLDRGNNADTVGAQEWTSWVHDAHNGEQLGQALFKIIKQVSIEKKVGYLVHDIVALTD